MHDKASIIEENKKRLSVFSKERDPITGIGSVLDRESIEFSDIGEHHIPYAMLDDEYFNEFLKYSSFTDYATANRITLEEAILIYSNIRFNYDFEYWSIVCAKIQHKKTLKIVPFLLRIAQQILLRELEDMRISGIPIRIVLLKARQWGGSTLVQMYMFWIQQVHRENWHLAVCAQDDGAARNISEMYKRSAQLYPSEFGIIDFKPYARSKNIISKQRGGIIGVGSINNPDQFRSFNYPMIHISEPGVWEDTPKRTAGQLVSSLRSTVSKEAFTLVVLESTAKGVGSFFHDEWLSAESRKSDYRGVFVPWYAIEMYQMDIEDHSRFIDGMNEYDWFLWNEGATLEGINWYNIHKTGENYDDWMMFNEFPTTAEEAFVASGDRYFAPKIVSQARKNVIKPKFTGTIHPVNVKNKQELEESHFVKAAKGNLEIWKMPRPIVKIKGELFHVANRYCTFADIGGVSDKADYSSITVIDRFQMLNGGWPELAADWHGHLDQDLFSWVFVQLSWLYDKAYAAIETNSLRKEKSSGDHFFTILDNIKDHYDNLYIRNEHERVDKDWTAKYGFHTNHGTKDMILSALRRGMRDEQYVERQKGACDEFDWFERKKDGTLGAIQGKNDDKVITRAGAYWLATSCPDMRPVKLIPVVTQEEKMRQRRNKNRTVSESTLP